MSKNRLIGLYFVFFFITASIATFIFQQISPTLPLILTVFFAMNVASFILFAFDKSMASMQNMPRLPELFFHLVALIGGSVGILVGSQIFRHKTKKVSFLVWPVIIFLLQLGLLAWFLRDYWQI